MENHGQVPRRDLGEQFSLLARAGDLHFQYQVTKGISFYGQMLARGAGKGGEYELYGETRLPLLNRATSHRLVILGGGREIREEARSGENLHLTTSVFPETGPGRMTVVPARGPTREYSLESRAFPVSIFLAPFFFCCFEELSLHFLGVPCWEVAPFRTRTPAPGETGIEEFSYRILTPLEGSATMGAETLEGVVIRLDSRDGIPVEISGEFQGYRVRVRR